MTVSGDALRSLAAATDNDIRSCLNTLQFVRAEATRIAGADNEDGSAPRFRVTTEMITRASVGLKDQTRALYDVLEHCFRKPDLRKHALVSASEIPEPIAEIASAGLGSEEKGNTSAAALRHDHFASAASVARAAHFQDLMGQVGAQAAAGICSILIYRVHPCNSSSRPTPLSPASSSPGSTRTCSMRESSTLP